MDGAGREDRGPRSPDVGPEHAGPPAPISPAEEQRLLRQIRVAAASARHEAALRRFGTAFDVALVEVCDELDRTFWTRDEWGSSFDRVDFARTVVGLVEGRPGRADPALVSAVLDSLEYTLTDPVTYRPGGVDWAATRCTTQHEETVAADAVAAVFEARADVASTRRRRGTSVP